MNFYSFSLSAEPEIIGTYPQAAEITDSFSEQDIGFRSKLNKEIKLPGLVLRPNAKLTSVLSTPINKLVYFICARDFVEFLLKFNLPDHSSYELKVSRDGRQIENYVLFHLHTPSDNEVIKYEESIFKIGEQGDWKDPTQRKGILISDYNNYVNTEEVFNNVTGKRLVPEKVKLNMDSLSYDFFRLETSAIRGFYISEKLKNSLSQTDLDGFIIKPIDEVHPKAIVKIC